MNTEKKLVDAEEFVRAWKTSTSRKEVAEKICISYAAVGQRFRYLRKKGVNINYMGTENRRGKALTPERIAALNAILAE